jgi:hypothetical protein
MKWLQYLSGAFVWRVKAGVWYTGLGLRLWFAIGLDRDFDPSKEESLEEMFRYPVPKSYRAIIGKPIEDPPAQSAHKT